MAVDLKKGGEIPNPAKDTVKLKATDKHPQLKEGTVFSIHPNHEAKLIDCGWAVDEDEKDTKAPKGKAPKKADVIAEGAGK